MNIQKAFAQSLSLAISPPIMELIIKPGKSVTYSFKLANDGDSAIITPDVRELNEFGLKDNPEFTPDKWLTLLNTDINFGQPFLLDKGQTKQIVLRVNIPSDLKEMDYYRALVFSSKPNPASDVSQSLVTQKLAAPLLIIVTSSGIIDRSARISKFDIPAVFDSFGPLTLDVWVKNTGRSFFHPNGKITLAGPLGSGSYSINTGAILSNQDKRINTDTDYSLSDKTLSLSGLFIGKYQVELSFQLDEGNVKIGQSKTVYALPIKLVIILIIIMLIFYRLRNRKNKHK